MDSLPISMILLAKYLLVIKYLLLFCGIAVLLLILVRSRRAKPATMPSPGSIANEPRQAAAMMRPLSRSASTAPHGRQIAPAIATLQPLFPDLELLQLIGQGGVGMVYQVRRRSDGVLLALKIVSAEGALGQEFASRFQRETEVLRRLDHPGIVAIREFGRNGPWCWLLMDYVEGANLRQVVATGALSSAQSLALVPPLCTALQYAHDQGIVHRDLKPENILVDTAGRPHLVDFGMAKIAETGEALTGSGIALGTVHYMAPEQVESSHVVDARADIYALGVIMYELLTGRLPLGRFEPPSHRVPMDARIDDIVMRALERDPLRRWQRIADVGSAVTSVIGATAGVGAVVPPVPMPMPMQGPAPRPAPSMASIPQGAHTLPSTSVTPKPWGVELNNFLMLLHLALFAGYLLLGGGFLLTIIMWATCRDLDPRIDQHGRIAINWIISAFIYAVICIALCFLLIGIPLFIALSVCGIVFPIIAAVKASRGTLWNYPMSIPFLRVPSSGDEVAGNRSGGPGLWMGIGCLGVVLLLALLVAIAVVMMGSVHASPVFPVH